MATNAVQIIIEGIDKASQIFQDIASEGERAIGKIKSSLDSLGSSISLPVDVDTSRIESTLRGIDVPNITANATVDTSRVESAIRDIHAPNITAQVTADTSRVESAVRSIRTPNIEAQVTADTSQAEREVKGLADKLKNIDIGDLGIAAAMGTATSSIANVNQAIRDTQAQLGISKSEAQDFGTVIKDVYKNNFGESIGDVQERVVTLNQTLGLTGKPLQDMTEDVTRVTDAFGKQGAETDAVANAIKSLKTSFPGMTEQKAIDLITNSFQQGAGKSGDLLDTLNEYPVQFAKAGYSADEMTKILIEGSKEGIMNTDKMADGIKEFGLRMTDGSKSTQQGLETIAKSMGVSTSQAQKWQEEFAKGGPSAQKATQEIMKGLDGIKDPLVKQQTGVALMGSQWEDTGGKIASVMTHANTNVKLHEDATKSLDSQYGGFSNTLEGWKRGFEVNVLGPLSGFAEPVGGAIEGLGSLGTAFMGLKALGLDGVVVGWVTKFGSFASTLTGPIVTAIKTAGSSMSFLMGPWGLVIAAVIAIVAAIVMNWDSVKEYAVKTFTWLGNFFSGVWDGIKTVASAAWDGIKSVFTVVWDVITSIFKNLTLPGILISHWDSIKSTVDSVWNGIKSFFGTVWDGIKAIFMNLTLPGILISHWDSIKSTINTVWNSIKSFFSSIWDGIKSVFTTAGTAITSALSTVWNGIKNTVTTIWNGIKDFFTITFNTIKNTITTIWNSIKDFFTTTFNTIKNTITTIWNSIKDFFTTTFNAIKTTITTVWNSIKDFFTTTFNAIKTTITTVWNSIKDFFTTTFNSIKTTATTVWNSIKDFFTTTFNSIKTTVTTVWNSIKDFFTTTINAIKTTLTTVVNSIKDTLSTTWNSIKSTVTTVWNAIKEFFSTTINSIKSTITSVVNGIKDTLSSTWNAIKSTATSVWNGIKDAVTTPINGAKSALTTTVNGIKDTLSSTWNSVKSTASSVWDGIKSAITSPITSAKSTIKGLIDDIKGFFSNFKVDIKMPHFSLETGSKTILGKTITYPTGFDVKWYATGGVFANPVMMGNGGFGDVQEAIIPFEGPHAQRIAGLIGKEMDTLKKKTGDGSGIYIESITIQANTEAEGQQAGRAFVDEMRRRGWKPTGNL